MQRIWQIKPQKHQDLIKQILANRGIEGDEQIAGFLNPSYEKLNNPFLFKDMEKAVNRIWSAIESKEKILIYSDYDADAVTANAVLFRMFKFLGVSPETYIPDRFNEGYGLNLEAFKKIKELGVTLVITVDCGTNSVAEAEFCKKENIDLIITDHHELTGDKPEAFALINPKNPDDQYPYHEITGVGVAFKLACAVLSKREKHNLPEGFEKWFLDLVTIGTIADCHSLLGENRVLVKFGLQVMKKTKWPGLRALLQLASVNPDTIDPYTVGFIIAPRINAAGRIEHASIAFELLTTDDSSEAFEKAKELELLNSKRQMLTETVMSEAREQLLVIQEHKVLLAVGKDWPKGVVGLVAGRLTEEFGKPVLILEQGELESTGSARSVRNFNIVEALNYSKECLVKYGGHAQAAGFTLKNEHIELFRKNLLDYAEQNLNAEDLNPIMEIDAVLFPKELTIANLESIEAIGPFGVDNVRPRLQIDSAIVQDMNAVGKDQKHLQMTVCFDEPRGRKYFKCIAFGFGKMIHQWNRGDKIDLVFEFLADNWNGNKNIKLRIVDFRKSGV